MNEIFLINQRDINKKTTIQLNIEGEIKEISSGTIGTLILTTTGKVYEYHEKKVKLKFDEAKKARVAFSHFLILKEDGNVYGYGRNRSAYLPPKNGDTKEFTEPIKLPFFEENGIEIIDICVGCCQCYYLSKNYTLYASGHNSRSELGLEERKSEVYPPQVVALNVKRLFSDDYSFFFFYEDFNQNFFASGENGTGQLGIGSPDSPKIPQIVPDLCNKKVITISCGYQHSIAIIEEENGNQDKPFHQIWIAGGPFKTDYKFRKIERFEERRVISVTSHCWDGCLLTDRGEIYDYNKNRDFENEIKPEYLNPISYINNYRIEFGISSLIYQAAEDFILIEDLQKLLENQEMTDFQIQGIDGSIHKAHQLIVQTRFCRSKKTSIEKITQCLSQKTKKEIQSFLQFVYTGKTLYFKEISEIGKELGIENINEKFGGSRKVRKSIIKLFSDEETKDFAIVVKDKEIRVHKIILLARSDLFRGMFLSVVDDFSNKVSDYSQRSFKQIYSIIRILYFDQIDSQTDSKTINDFQDVIDYYQLNPRMRELIKNRNEKMNRRKFKQKEK
ncbi:hypothetical protein M0811_06458 [Anaeramoeba ignava]|uniref:BTB domain-containing protein n=1 Tax=Anaeramoeba ignava TaxID=1746090 RepID=A0A9Q0LP84_ANAIG|nr:hypothetical protein M0811_06458 [Anaeramoeba ignava]